MSQLISVYNCLFKVDYFGVCRLLDKQLKEFSKNMKNDRHACRI